MAAYRGQFNLDDSCTGKLPDPRAAYVKLCPECSKGREKWIEQMKRLVEKDNFQRLWAAQKLWPRRAQMEKAERVQKLGTGELARTRALILWTYEMAYGKVAKPSTSEEVLPRASG